MVSQKGRKCAMMIKMLLEEAGQFFYCEARKTASHEFEGIVHFLHKVGDGNAFVRGKTLHGKQIAVQSAPTFARGDDNADFEADGQNAGRIGSAFLEKPAC
jgi:hypothetical protein